MKLKTKMDKAVKMTLLKILIIKLITKIINRLINIIVTTENQILNIRMIEMDSLIQLEIIWIMIRATLTIRFNNLMLEAMFNILKIQTYGINSLNRKIKLIFVTLHK